jgi:hypothetical protein
MSDAVQWRPLMGRMSRERKARATAKAVTKPEPVMPKGEVAGSSQHRQAKRPPQSGRVVPLVITPERGLERAARRFLQDPGNACDKCGSTFIVREPAFVHCHYCGKMARIANASLGAQELFELRLGLRLAS